MGRSIDIKVEGMVDVKRMLQEVGLEFKPYQVRDLLKEAGREVVKKARKRVNYGGQITRFFKKDLGVFNGRGKGMDSAYVTIGPRYNVYNIDGREEKVAVIAQHLTEGFNQNDRKTKSKGRRGKVADQFSNPVIEGWNDSETERNAAINRAMQKKLRRVQSKHKNVLI